jgi:hypothetical protein
LIEKLGLRVKEVEGQGFWGTGTGAGVRGLSDTGAADRGPSGARSGGRLFKIAVPLSDARLTAFRAALTQGG